MNHPVKREAVRSINTRNRGIKLMGRELMAVALLILMIAGYLMLAFGLLAEAFSKKKTGSHRRFD
jgi:hypothetical protein